MNTVDKRTYFLAAGESLRILEAWRAECDAACERRNAFADEYGCTTFGRDAFDGFSVLGLVPPNTAMPCPMGWRERRRPVVDLEGKERMTRVFLPDRKTKEGRALVSRLEALMGPGKGKLRELFPELMRSQVLGDMLSTPGVDQLLDGRHVIIGLPHWGKALDATPLKTSEYYALKGD